MKSMTELDLARIGDIKNYVPGLVMTFVTTAGNAESNVCVMTCSA